MFIHTPTILLYLLLCITLYKHIGNLIIFNRYYNHTTKHTLRIITRSGKSFCSKGVLKIRDYRVIVDPRFAVGLNEVEHLEFPCHIEKCDFIVVFMQKERVLFIDGLTYDRFRHVFEYF